MDRTFATLLASLEKHSIHEFKPGRKSFYSIPDIMDKGLEQLLVTNRQHIECMVDEGIMDESEEFERPELEDVVIELL